MNILDKTESYKNSFKESIMVSTRKSNSIINQKFNEIDKKDKLNVSYMINLKKDKFDINIILKILNCKIEEIYIDTYKEAINKIIKELERKKNWKINLNKNKSNLLKENTELTTSLNIINSEINGLSSQSDINRNTILKNDLIIDKMKLWIKKYDNTNKKSINNLNEINNFLIKNNLIQGTNIQIDQEININTKISDYEKEIEKLKLEVDKYIEINVNSPNFILLNRKVGNKDILGESKLMKEIREKLKNINYLNVHKQKKELEIKILKEKNKKENSDYNKNISKLKKKIDDYEKKLENLGAQLTNKVSL